MESAVESALVDAKNLGQNNSVAWTRFECKLSL